jgi:aryl-alcohol dehydrogenase-like predicted oxidoreductase
MRTRFSAHTASVAQIAIAWVLSRGDDIVPVIGARRRDRLAESLGALPLTLEEEDLSTLEKTAASAAGARYAEAQMAHLDSEQN